MSTAAICTSQFTAWTSMVLRRECQVGTPARAKHGRERCPWCSLLWADHTIPGSDVKW